MPVETGPARVIYSDFNTYNYGYIGTRATGNMAGDYMVVGPGVEGRDVRTSRETLNYGPGEQPIGLAVLLNVIYETSNVRMRSFSSVDISIPGISAPAPPMTAPALPSSSAPPG